MEAGHSEALPASVHREIVLHDMPGKDRIFGCSAAASTTGEQTREELGMIRELYEVESRADVLELTAEARHEVRRRTDLKLPGRSRMCLPQGPLEHASAEGEARRRSGRAPVDRAQGASCAPEVSMVVAAAEGPM